MQKHPSLPSWLHGREDHKAGRQFGPWHLTPWHIVFDSRWIRSKLCIPVYTRIYPISTPWKILQIWWNCSGISESEPRCRGLHWLDLLLVANLPQRRSPESGRKLLIDGFRGWIDGAPISMRHFNGEDGGESWNLGVSYFHLVNSAVKATRIVNRKEAKSTITGTKCKISPSNRKNDIAYIYWGQCNNRVQWNQINPESTATIIGYST